MTTPEYLPGTDIEAHTVDARGNPKRVRDLYHALWTITDTRPGICAEADRLGYRMAIFGRGLFTACLGHHVSGNGPAAMIVPEPVTDARHVRTYGSEATRVIFEAAIAKEIAKCEAESRRRRAREARDARRVFDAITYVSPHLANHSIDRTMEGSA